MEVSGINLDLLNETEQQDVFEDYGAFLMSTLGEGVDDTLQFLEPTIPVNMTAYLNGLKRRYLALQKDHPAINQFGKILNLRFGLTTRWAAVALMTFFFSWHK